jgi:hypothetical protein
MKGFIEVFTTDNTYPHIINVQTIATVRCINESTGASSIKLIAKNDYGKDVFLQTPSTVHEIKALMEAALKKD